jgi:DUF2911 family protein
MPSSMEVKRMAKRVTAAGVAWVVAGAAVAAATQDTRPPNLTAASVAQVGANGKWIEITYGRPLKGGRDVWGSGADYAKALLVNGAKIWRAGAKDRTRLKTQVALQIGGKTVPAGEYSLFIETKSPQDWTLIVSSWRTFDPSEGFRARGAPPTSRPLVGFGGTEPDSDGLWGAPGYTPGWDVARVAMKIGKLPMAIDQLTWNFADVTPAGGKLVLMWGTVVASAPFRVP